MIMDASSKIAVKCSECGKFNLVKLNFFNMRSTAISVACECGHRMLKAQVSARQLVLEIQCIACEKPHVYRFKLSDVMEKPTTIISCQETGMEIAFLGKDDYVDEIVDRSVTEMKEIFESFGFIGNLTQKVVK